MNKEWKGTGGAAGFCMTWELLSTGFDFWLLSADRFGSRESSGGWHFIYVLVDEKDLVNAGGSGGPL